jgi:hypothetical protein
MQSFVFRSKAALGAFLVSLASGCAAHIPEKTKPEPYLSRSDPGEVAPADSQAAKPGEKAPGIIVYIDPQSGEITAGPSAALPAQRGQQSLESAGQPVSELQETLSPVPGGGVVIHLGERFSTPLTATIDADGKLRLEHLPTLPDSDNQK